MYGTADGESERRNAQAADGVGNTAGRQSPFQQPVQDNRRVRRRVMALQQEHQSPSRLKTQAVKLLPCSSCRDEPFKAPR
jgi:hypothetical protein